MNQSNKLLSDLVFYRSYSKYLPHLNRREFSEETINRCMTQHLDKFSNLGKGLSADITRAFSKVQRYEILPSMRSLQYSGEPLLKNELRSYNCAYLPIDDIRAFDEVIYLLLSGCGVGFSVSRKDINKLPFVKPPKGEFHYVIADSIEGWAGALQVLVEAYFLRRMRPMFDYSLIRPLGSRVSIGAIAPGPQPLKAMLEIVETKLKEAIGRKLRPIEAHDIICIISDCVLSGGVRRSALINLFDSDDQEMLNCKSGTWYEKHPYRARANNSAILHKDATTFEQFSAIFDVCKNSNSGEPGWFWRPKNSSFGTNPCQPAFAKVLTKEGIREFSDINIGSMIWSGKKWTTVVDKVYTGKKEVYEFITTAGRFIGTKNHKICEFGAKIEASMAKFIDTNSINPSVLDFSEQIVNKTAIMDGLVIGDGTVHKASNNLVLLCVGLKDKDLLNDIDIKYKFKKERNGIGPYVWEIETSINSKELPNTYDRKIPDRFYKGNSNIVRSFLRGLYSANGSICGNRISLKQTSRQLVLQVQEMLSSIGIRSYITTNKKITVKHKNGVYISKESYDLNISIHKDQEIFKHIIGFIQFYKMDKLEKILKRIPNNNNKLSFEIKEIKSLGVHDVWDITVDADEHTYWTSCLLVSNCAEIALNPNQLCNLTEINLSSVTSKKDFLSRVHSATLIGTLQASYTDFPWLREQWKTQTEVEALLGVSCTGIADKTVPVEWLEEGAKLALEVNEYYAKKIGINKAARITTVKPAGSTSAVLGCASGIHARHSKYYARRIRMNKTDTLAMYLQEQVPHLVENDVFSSTGIVVTIPQETPEGAILRSSETALSLLERAIIWNKSWIKPAHRYGDNPHNVSLTISVKPEEWEGLKENMWAYRDFYTGISLLPYDGAVYPQMPFEEIDKKKFDEMLEYVKDVDIKEVKEYQDLTDIVKTVACGANGCDIL